MIEDELDEGVPYFFERLALGDDADGRAVRRAYAREVKLLDQEHQATEFQSLRECYDAAMRWAAHQEWLKANPGGGDDGDGEAASVAASADPAGEPPLPVPSATAPQPEVGAEEPAALATLVFERLQQIRTRLTEPGELNDVGSWEAEIRARLDDEELVNISASWHFEGMIAHALAFDFQVGQYAFFKAAAEVFDWQRDRRRLLEFGYAGSIVNQAIDEGGMFYLQYEPDMAVQRGVFDRLRREAAPTEEELVRDLVTFEKMHAQFPHLMAMRIPEWKIEQWRDGCMAMRKAHGDDAFNVGSSAAPAHDWGGGGFDNHRWLIWVVFVVILNFGRNWFSDPAPHVAQSPRVNAPAAAPYVDSEPSAPQTMQLPMNYKPAPDSPKGKRVVTVEIMFDGDGKVTSAVIVSPSIDPAFDKAVAAAFLRLQFQSQSTWTAGKMRFTQTHDGPLR